MKAMVQDRYGAADVLELRDVPTPRVGPGEVLVQVRAASVNPLDWHFMRGEPLVMRLAGVGLRTPKRRIQGADVAGTVEALGPGVRGLTVGDDVLGWAPGGGFAEYVAVPADHLVPKPASLSFEEAGAVAIAGSRPCRRCGTTVASGRGSACWSSAPPAGSAPSPSRSPKPVAPT